MAAANEARLTAKGKRRGKASSLNTVLFATRLTTPTSQQRTPTSSGGYTLGGMYPRRRLDPHRGESDRRFVTAGDRRLSFWR